MDSIFKTPLRVLFLLVLFYGCSKEGSQIIIINPLNHTVYPADMAAPVFRWNDRDGSVKQWKVSIRQDDKIWITKNISDQPEFKPTSGQWKTMVETNPENPWIFEVSRVKDGQEVSERMDFSVSRDKVNAAIFFRGVPLPFKFARENIKKVKWYLGDIGKDQKPHAVMEDIPVCANCHSFSQNGKTIAMDVDALDDKGAYVISRFSTQTNFAIDSIISWGKFQDNKFTYGLLSQISPNGRYVVSTLHDCEIFADRKNLEYSQLFFPFKGILVIYDRVEKRYFELPGANDTLFVQSNPSWSPDGKTILFARSRAKHFEESGIMNGSVPVKTAEATERYRKFEKSFMDRDSLFKFDIYTIPFNDGKGGKALPLPGASENGKSNYFPKISPDGKWLVFCQAESFMLLQKDSRLMIMPAKGGTPHEMECNTQNMNSWHSWSPNSKWLVFSSKSKGPYTQLYLTHINEDGSSTPPVWLENFTFENYAGNIPEFTNSAYDPELKINPDFLREDDFLVRQGEIALKKGDKEAAFVAFNQAIKKFPKNNEAYYNRGKLLYEKNKLPEAMRDLNKALEITKSMDYYVARGVLYIKMGNFPYALKDLKEALDIDSTDNKANSYMGIVCSQTGKMELAIHYLNKAIQRSKSDYYSNYILGRIYISMSEYSKAITCFADAYEYCADDQFAAQILLLKGASLANLGNLKDAISSMDEAVKLAPNNATLYLERGKMLLQNGNELAARTSLMKAGSLGSREAASLLKQLE